MSRQNISSGAKWESIVSYSRGVRIGDFIEVAGTVASDENGPVHKDDPYLQSIYILNKIRDTIEKLGGNLQDVIRTRMYVTNIDQWEAIGRAHGEIFKGINPVTTMVEVSRLIDPAFLVEIEASAYLDSN